MKENPSHTAATAAEVDKESPVRCASADELMRAAPKAIGRRVIRLKQRRGSVSCLKSTSNVPKSSLPALPALPALPDSAQPLTTPSTYTRSLTSSAGAACLLTTMEAILAERKPTQSLIDQLFTDSCERGRALQYIELEKKNRHGLFHFQNVSVMSLGFAAGQLLQLSMITPLIRLKAERQAHVVWMVNHYLRLPTKSDSPQSLRGRRSSKTKLTQAEVHERLKLVVEAVLTSEEATVYEQLSIKKLKQTLGIRLPAEYDVLYNSALKKLAQMCEAIEKTATRRSERQAELSETPTRPPYTQVLPTGFVELQALIDAIESQLGEIGSESFESDDLSFFDALAATEPWFQAISFRQHIHQALCEHWEAEKAERAKPSTPHTPEPILAIRATDAGAKPTALFLPAAKLPMLMTCILSESKQPLSTAVPVGLSRWLAYEQFKSRVSKKVKRGLYKFSCLICGLPKDDYSTAQMRVYNNLLTSYAYHFLHCDVEDKALLGTLLNVDRLDHVGSLAPKLLDEKSQKKYLRIPECVMLLQQDEITFMNPATQSTFSYYSELVAGRTVNELDYLRNQVALFKGRIEKALPSLALWRLAEETLAKLEARATEAEQATSAIQFESVLASSSSTHTTLTQESSETLDEPQAASGHVTGEEVGV